MSTRTDLVHSPSSSPLPVSRRGWGRGFGGLVLALLAASSGTGDLRAQAVAAAAPVQALPDESFEMWVFNNQGNASTARQKFDALLKLRIDEIDRHCCLSEEQKQKLQLMGCGDMKQIFDSFEKAKHQFNLLNNDVQKLNEIMPLVQSIQLAQRKLLQDESLFAKSLRHTLTQEQFARYKKGEELPAPREKAPANGGGKP